MTSGSNGGWAWLPNNLLDSILEDLGSTEDRIRFSAVCTAWRSVAVENFGQLHANDKSQVVHLPRHVHQPRQLPLLMVSTQDNSKDRRGFYSVTHKKMYKFQLPMPYDNIRCCGSSYGWLIMVDNTFSVILFNPFSGKTLCLPPLRRLLYEKRYKEEDKKMRLLPPLQRFEYEKQMRAEYGEEEIGEDEEFPDAQEEEEEEEEETDPYILILAKSDYSIRKAVLSIDPDLDPDNFLLMAIYGVQERLAFIKSGDKEWTYIDQRVCNFEYFLNSYSLKGFQYFSDIIFWKDRFYALHSSGQLLSCEVNNNLTVKGLIISRDLECYCVNSFLVESSQGTHLLRVTNLSIDSTTYITYMTDGCLAHKLIDYDGNLRWVEMESLDDDALFLGGNHSISVLASDFPRCHPNSIYFCDNDFYDYYLRGGPCDIGEYNLKNGGKIDRYYPLDHSQELMPPPIWILPTFM